VKMDREVRAHIEPCPGGGDRKDNKGETIKKKKKKTRLKHKPNNPKEGGPGIQSHETVVSENKKRVDIGFGGETRGAKGKVWVRYEVHRSAVNKRKAKHKKGAGG